MSFIESQQPSFCTQEKNPAVHAYTDSLRRSVSELSPAEEMKKLGISTDFELQRYYKVSEVAGETIAFREIQRNVHAYNKEFIQDIPISDFHDYYHINGKLYSEPILHELFCIERQMDPRERDGKTLRGFQKFQELVTEEAATDEVVVWYSPAGKAGTEAPFSDIYFDSGRLYLCFKDDKNRSRHIDIKVQEDAFPIKEFLDWINWLSTGNRTPTDMSVTDAGFYYLEHPLRPRIRTFDFIAILQDFSQQYAGKSVYISQRDSKNAQSFSLDDIFQELYTGGQNKHPDAAKAVPGMQRMKGSALTKQQIQDMYLHGIATQMQENGGKVVLYGCSTTSVLDQTDAPGLGYAGASQGYSTWNRVMDDAVISKSASEILGLTSEYHESYKCPHCKKTLSGEHKTKIHTWRTNCDHCGGELRCAKK